MMSPRFRVLAGTAAIAVLSLLPARASAWPELINTDYPSIGWYLFHGPLLFPRFNVPPTYALTQLDYQHAGIGFTDFGAGFGAFPFGEWPYGYEEHHFGRRPPLPPPPPPGLLPPAIDPFAHFCVNVPEDAEVWLEGVPMHQTGRVRTFVSPPLDPSGAFAYTVRARWQEGGRVVEQSQELVVQNGARVSVTFPMVAPKTSD